LPARRLNFTTKLPLLTGAHEMIFSANVLAVTHY